MVAIASAIFLANGVDQSRVEDEEYLRFEDIPLCKLLFPTPLELLSSPVHALDIICSPSINPSSKIRAVVRSNPMWRCRKMVT